MKHPAHLIHPPMSFLLSSGQVVREFMGKIQVVEKSVRIVTWRSQGSYNPKSHFGSTWPQLSAVCAGVFTETVQTSVLRLVLLSCSLGFRRNFPAADQTLFQSLHQAEDRVLSSGVRSYLKNVA